MTAPPPRFGAHDRGALLLSEPSQPLQPGAERFRPGVIGVIAKARVLPKLVGRSGERAAARAAELGEVLVGDAALRKVGRQRLDVELRIGPGARDCPHVRQQLHAGALQQLDEVGDRARRMADGKISGHGVPADGRRTTGDGPASAGFTGNLSRPRPCNEFACIRPLPSVVPYSFPVQRSELSAKVDEAGSGRDAARSLVGGSRIPKGVIMSAWSNCRNKCRALAAGIALVALSRAALPVLAQDQQQQQQEQQQQRLSDQQLQQLVAPVALYPDPLLAQILTASTYPLEVVMAARWSKDNPALKSKDLENAMQQQPSDPSVKGLTAVPQVLTMMNDKLDWTQQLGEAFLVQPDDITKAVQALRAQAEANGHLKNSKEQRVRREAAPPPYGGEVVVVPEYIAIEPFEPEVIYVPVYDPV